MKDRGVGSGYLLGSSGVSWEEVRLQIPDSLATDVEMGETDTLYVGKDYHVQIHPGQMWRLWQSFLRFEVSGKLDEHDRVDEIWLRLAVKENYATGLGVRVGIMSAGWGDEIGTEDWIGGLVGGTGGLEAYVETTLEEGLDPGPEGMWWSVKLSEEMVALVKERESVDLVVMVKDILTAPIKREYISAHSVGSIEAEKRPHLKVVRSGMRQQIIDALIERMREIKELDGYETTVKDVYPVPVVLQKKDECEFPLVYVWGGEEEATRQASYVDERDWMVILGAAVWGNGALDQCTKLNRLMDDIQRAVEKEDGTGESPLALGDKMISIHTRRVSWNVEGFLDQNRAEGFVMVDCKYHRVTKED